MAVIRGAITIDSDNETEISEAVKQLLDEIFIRNELKKEDVEAIVFSLTTDIHSFHPAKAARECGYDFAPLFACTEPEIAGGLPFCIRCMVLIGRPAGKNSVKHVYLKGAVTLRTDISSVYNIALDGPAGSGKSTVAKMLAADYNILYLDTGAMYRACALKASREKIPLSDEEKISAMMGSLDLKVKYKDGTQHTLLDGEDVSEEIRKNEISSAASRVSAYPVVREKMVHMQRKIALSMSCVLDGRDIGSTVLPDAKFKFFLTADSAVRAKRRFDELVARGQKVDYEILKAEIEQRDKQDCERTFSPLKRAADAIEIDTSALTVVEVVQKIKSLIQSKI